MESESRAETVAAKKSTKADKPAKPPNTFMVAVQALNKGEVLDELDETLRTIVRAVRLLGRKGKLRLDLTVRPASKGDTTSLMIEHDIVATPPEPDRPADFFFAHGEDGIGQSHPDQLTISLRDGPDETTRTIREA